MNISPPSAVTRDPGLNKMPLVPAGRMLPFVLVTALFFLWGVPNNLNDILIRQFMKSL